MDSLYAGHFEEKKIQQKLADTFCPMTFDTHCTMVGWCRPAPIRMLSVNPSDDTRKRRKLVYNVRIYATILRNLPQLIVSDCLGYRRSNNQM